jgi:hypothetical protein
VQKLGDFRDSAPGAVRIARPAGACAGRLGQRKARRASVGEVGSPDVLGERRFQLELARALGQQRASAPDASSARPARARAARDQLGARRVRERRARALPGSKRACSRVSSRSGSAA